MSNHLVPYEYYKFITNTILIDLRPDEIISRGSFPGAVSFPADGFKSKEHFLLAIRIKWPSQILYIFDQKEEFSQFYIGESQFVYLKGGYDNYLEWQNNLFREGKHILILGGKAGSGKTECICGLAAKGEQVLDLENLADHKGSVFGNLRDERQQSNDAFRHRIFRDWFNFDLQQAIWIEEEGPFLGHNAIPPVLYQHMLDATMLELEVPFRKRLEHLVEEYSHEPEEKFITAIRKLEKRMGTSANHKALHFYQKKDFTSCFSLLLRYYDSSYEQRRLLYRKGIHHRLETDQQGSTELIETLIAWRKGL